MVKTSAFSFLFSMIALFNLSIAQEIEEKVENECSQTPTLVQAKIEYDGSGNPHLPSNINATKFTFDQATFTYKLCGEHLISYDNYSDAPIVINFKGLNSGSNFLTLPYNVVIENCLIEANSDLIFSILNRFNSVEIRNCVILGKQRNKRCERAFPTVMYNHYPKKFIFENNYIEHCGGLILVGDKQPREINVDPYVQGVSDFCQTDSGINFYSPQVEILISRNKFRNTDGRISDGSECGFYGNKRNPIECTDLNGKCLNGKFCSSSPMTIQLAGLVRLEKAEISWNEIINEPNNSSSHDVISLYNSGGFSSSKPILIENNYIQGIYNFPADLDFTTQNGVFNWVNFTNPCSGFNSYYPANLNFATGGFNEINRLTNPIGGINIDGQLWAYDAWPGFETYSTYVHVKSNQIVSTNNYGIFVAGGNQNKVIDNTIVSSGKIEDSQNFQGRYFYSFYLHYGGYFNDLTQTQLSSRKKIFPIADHWTAGINISPFLGQSKSNLFFPFDASNTNNWKAYYSDPLNPTKKIPANWGNNDISSNSVNYSAWFKDDVSGNRDCLIGQTTTSPKIFAIPDWNNIDDINFPYGLPNLSYHLSNAYIGCTYGNDCDINTSDVNGNTWGEATYEDELIEYQVWLNKKSSAFINNGIHIGPIPNCEYGINPNSITPYLEMDINSDKNTNQSGNYLNEHVAYSTINVKNNSQNGKLTLDPYHNGGVKKRILKIVDGCLDPYSTNSNIYQGWNNSGENCSWVNLVKDPNNQPKIGVVKNVDENNELILFPNPAQDRLNMHINNSEIKILKVEFISIQGSIAFEIIGNHSNNINFKIPKIESGFYSVKVITNHGVLRSSIIKTF